MAQAEPVSIVFEWDAAAHERGRQERGFGFDTAAAIFAGPVVEWRDERRDYGEERMVALGAVDDLVLVVVYADRGHVRRIVSARAGNRKERGRWQLFVSP